MNSAKVRAARTKRTAQFGAALAEKFPSAWAFSQRLSDRMGLSHNSVQRIQSAELALGGLAIAFMQLGAMSHTEQQQRASLGLQSGLQIPMAEAEHLLHGGARFVQQFSGPKPAYRRLARRIYQINGPSGLGTTLAVIGWLATGIDRDLSRAQKRAVKDIRTMFGTA